LGEVLVSDSTSVNFYKLALAALDARPGRRVIVSDTENFPTDRYILEGIAEQRGYELRLIPSDIDGAVTAEELLSVMDEEVALVTFSHVAYRSGALADMASINRHAHAYGALTLWDLSHSVGSVPIELDQDDFDLAVGCTYKYLNGGPGSPAFLCVRTALQDELRQPIWGWFSQEDQFDMGDRYRPKVGIERFLVGTPPVIQLQSLALSLDILSQAGIGRLRAKGMLITDALASIGEELLVPVGFRCASPKQPSLRGSHMTYAHGDAALINRYLGMRSTVVTDYRTPDRIRIAPVPLYVSFEELYVGVETISQVTQEQRYRCG
jgi:kynureninase